jgi:hypothetical protein
MGERVRETIKAVVIATAAGILFLLAVAVLSAIGGGVR